MRCYVSSCINDSFRLDCGLTAKAKTEQVRLGGYGGGFDGERGEVGGV